MKTRAAAFGRRAAIPDAWLLSRYRLRFSLNAPDVYAGSPFPARIGKHTVRRTGRLTVVLYSWRCWPDWSKIQSLSRATARRSSSDGALRQSPRPADDGDGTAAFRGYHQTSRETPASWQADRLTESRVRPRAAVSRPNHLRDQGCRRRGRRWRIHAHPRGPIVRTTTHTDVSVAQETSPVEHEADLALPPRGETARVADQSAESRSHHDNSMAW